METKPKAKISTTAIAIIIIASLCIVAAASYIYWTSVTIPFEVKGIEIIDYPELISQNPGENRTYNITIRNSVENTYNVTLTFNLTNTAYFTEYVTVVAEDFYTVAPLTDTIVSIEIQISPAAYPITDLEFQVDFYIVP